MSRYEVRVAKDYLVFPAGHFITYGGVCETLHGHNYRASVAVEGELDENYYVLDFGVLKRVTKEIIDELDHKMLLPTRNPHLELEEEPTSVRVRFEDRLYVFPRRDVALLPVPNTTAEMLARHLAGRLRSALDERGVTNLSRISVEVEESFGQSAIYEEAVG